MKSCVLLHKGLGGYLTFRPSTGINQGMKPRAGDFVSTKVNQSRMGILPGQEAFRERMEQQCHQIRQYRQSVLRDSGRLLSPDEAALEWIAQYAAHFDTTSGAGT
jgi:hypothetical protein